MISVLIWLYILYYNNVLIGRILSFYHYKNHKSNTFCTLDLLVKLSWSPLRKGWQEKIYWLSCFPAFLPEVCTGQLQLCQTLTPVKTQIASAKIWQSDSDWWALSCLAHEEGSHQPSDYHCWRNVSHLCVWGIAPVFDNTLQVIDTALSPLGDSWHSFGSANKQGPSQCSTTNQCGPVNAMSNTNRMTFGKAFFHMNVVFNRMF